jgi:hypothetical protein
VSNVNLTEEYPVLLYSPFFDKKKISFVSCLFITISSLSSLNGGEMMICVKENGEGKVEMNNCLLQSYSASLLHGFGGGIYLACDNPSYSSSSPLPSLSLSFVDSVSS